MERVNKGESLEEDFDHKELGVSFSLPSLELLNDPVQRQDPAQIREIMEATARRLEEKLLDFGIKGEITGIQPGPVITLYEFRPAPGIKISRIANLADDLALGLKAVSIRIIAPIPGKDAVGIEIPNPQKEIVYLKEILSSKEYQDSNLRLPLALGKDTVGRPVIADLSKMPHLLVAGATGTGKSVCINAMVHSLLFRFSPDLIKFIMVDPKRIELSLYDDIPHLLHPVVTHPKEATGALKWAVREMERRYELLLQMGAKNLAGYNAKVLKERRSGVGEGEILPYIVIIIDELADLMIVSSKEVEDSIARLAQMARASGIHLILATQRPSVDVLTGLIKANFPARISFQVSSKVDSRTILDRIGAERLLGEGDMLFMPPGVGRLLRIHGAYVSEDEVQRVTDYLRSQARPNYQISLLEPEESDTDNSELEADEKYQEAVDLVIRTGQASISMIQRRLRVGYNRAARMIELMEKQGIVGPSDGIKPREVYGRK
ncbi:MAG: DNA translocase FtsK [Desulfatiglandales bacterium]